VPQDRNETNGLKDWNGYSFIAPSTFIPAAW
jgi:hypothetical protein